MHVTKARYLVRKLTIIDDKGVESVHSLVYFDVDSKGKISITPFDRERPGYEYLDSLVVTSPHQ